MSKWQPISSAPKDGTRFIAKGFRIGGGRNFNDLHGRRYRLLRFTWYGKASHVPLYGWCHGRVEDVDLWNPTHWMPIPEQLRKGKK